MGLLTLIALIIAILVAISVHEAAHAWTANLFGDPTARLQGRMSLNPFRHLDPLGTICLFLAGFGWGKPVQVNPYNLKNPRKDQAFISLAGPLANFFTAAIFAIPLKYLGTSMPFALSFVLTITIEINLVLMVFNLIPIPPLDGSKILFALLPASAHNAIGIMERYGSMLLLIVILIDRSTNISILSMIFRPTIDYLKAIIFFST